MRIITYLLMMMVWCSGESWALPVVYTDRTAFEAASNVDHVLTFEQPDPVSDAELWRQVASGFFTPIYEQVLAVTYDSAAFRSSRPGGAPSGALGFGAGGGYTTVGRTLSQVSAMGFDVVYAPDPSVWMTINGTWYQLGGLSFFGLVWDAPTDVVMASAGGESRIYVIDNLALAVPEPGLVLLLSVGLCVPFTLKQFA